MLDLRGVAALEALQRRGTIAAAAASLGYTASAVSQQLGALERSVGVALVDRGPRYARVNAAGVAYLGAAAEVATTLVRAREEAAAASGRLSGRVLVAAIPSLAVEVASVLAELRSAEPLIDVVLVQANATKAQRLLLDDEIDVAVIDDWGTRVVGADTRLRTRLVRADPVGLAVHSSLRRSPGTTASEVARGALQTVPLLCATAGNYSREFADATLAGFGITAPSRWEFDGLEILTNLVAHGHGIAFLPTTSLSSALGHRVELIPLFPGSDRRVMCLWRTGERASTAVRLALSQLTHILAVPDPA